MNNTSGIKECEMENCFYRNLLLTKCDKCNKNYCDDHYRNHGCKSLEVVITECQKCNKIITEDMLDNDYQSLNIRNIKILNDNIKKINNQIEIEIKRELEKQLQQRSSDNKSYIFNKNTTNVEISERIESKYRDHLIRMRQLKHKFILNEQKYSK